jgi:hypothetical protein
MLEIDLIYTCNFIPCCNGEGEEGEAKIRIRILSELRKS